MYNEMTKKEKDWMKELRIVQGLSYFKIGKIMDRHPSSINYYFNSDVKNKKVMELKKRLAKLPREVINQRIYKSKKLHLTN